MYLKKYIFLLIILLLIIGFLPNNKLLAKADDLSNNINEQLGELDFSKIEDYLSSNEEIFTNGFDDFINKMINGQKTYDVNTILDAISTSFLSELKVILPDFLTIIIISLVYMVIANFTNDDKTVKNALYFVCISVIVIILSKNFITSYTLTTNCINNIKKIIDITSPIILTLMITSGANSSATIYQPTAVYLVNIISSIIIYVILPLVKIITILSILNNLSDDLSFKSFINFFSGLIKTILGVLFAVFAIFITVQGITSASYDGIYLRATKYAISNSVPIIGGYLSGGFDLVVAGSVLIKNAVGVGALVMILFAILKPLTYLICLSLMIKLTAGLTEIFSDKKISNTLLDFNNSIKTLSVSISANALTLFVFIIILIITAGAYF
jgi:stage III sporulation protein AE